MDKSNTMTMIIDIANRIEKDINYDDLTMMMDYCTLCYYISESTLFDICIRDIYRNKGKEKLNYIIMNINKFRFTSGLWIGYVGLGYLLNAYNCAKEYDIVLEKLNQFILSYAYKYLDLNIIKNKKLMNSHYDIINGICCIGIYLIEFNIDNSYVIKSVDYLNMLFGESKELFSNFKIYTENITNMYYKKINCDGYIDLSLSHGILGCAAYLAKSLMVYDCNKTKETLNFIISQFINNYFDMCSKGYFPSSLIYDSNKQKYIVNYSDRSSWCYGILGGLRVVYEILLLIHDYKLRDKIIKYILKLQYIGINNYNLICPTFCHGYSGIWYIYHLYKNEGIKIDGKFLDTIEEIIWSFYDANNKYGFLKYETHINGDLFTIDDRTSPLDGVISILIPMILKYDFCGFDYFSRSLCIQL